MDPEPAQPLGGLERLWFGRRSVCHQWVLFRMIMICPSVGSHRDSGALVRILLWAGFYLGLLKLLSNREWTLSH